jgi:hypothetical protein
MSMDNGYFSGLNLHTVDKYEIDGYIATDREEKPADTSLESTDRKFVKADVIYDAEGDVFICPAGEKLITNPASKAQRKSYRANKDVCKKCPYRSQCSGSRKDAGRLHFEWNHSNNHRLCSINIVVQLGTPLHHEP